MPSPAARIFRHALVGREPEVADLRAALGSAREGHGQLLLISGEPGIGKTRLAEEAEEVALRLGMRALWGRCHEIEGQPPFWAWMQVLRAYAQAAGAERVAGELDADTLPLAQLVPELLPHLPSPSSTTGADSDSARFRLFLGVTSLLRRWAGQGPMLLVIDDLHWADAGSLRLLDFLSYEIAQLPIVVLATYRAADLQQSAHADIIGGLQRRAHSIALIGLNAEEVDRFLQRDRLVPLAEAWAKRLHEITEGNPFFLSEMLRWLDTRSGDAPTSSLPLPQGVLAAIRQRLRALPADVVSLLGTAAVGGRDFALHDVAAVLGADEPSLRDQLQPALDREILRSVAGPPRRLRFVHGLVHEAILAELPAPLRLDLHRRYGELLEAHQHEATDTMVSEIAHHFYEAAAAGTVQKGAIYCERAGEFAMQALAFEIAVLQFTRALHLLDLARVDNPAQRCEIQLRLGEAANRSAQAPESLAAYQSAADLARRCDSPIQLARAALGLCGVGSTWAQFGRYDPNLIDTLQEALRILPPTEIRLRARLMARLATELHFAPEPSDTDRLSASAVALARQTGDTETLAYTLPARLRCSTPDQRQERSAILDELLLLTGGRGELAVHAYVWRLSEVLQSGEMAEVAACREVLMATVRELRQPREMWLIPAMQGQKHLLDGRLDDAETSAQAILAHENLSPNGRMAALVLLFLIRREQARLGELADGMRTFAYQSATVNAWRTNLALLHAETGDAAAAKAELDALVDEGLTCLRRDNTWMLGVAGLAGAAALVGTPEQAETIYRTLLPYAGRNIVAASFFYIGPVSYYLGILAQRHGRYAQALPHLEEAIAAARAAGSPAYVARALVAKAKTIEVVSPHEVVLRELQEEAHHITSTLGLRAIVTTGPGEQSGGRDVLTAPAMRVVSLVRLGDGWALSFLGRTSILKARRGMDHLARLLASPRELIHVLDLAGAAARESTALPDALLDSAAKSNLRARMGDLRSELFEAEEHNDLARAQALRAEIDAVAEHLAEALGLGGRDRHFNAAAQRARAAVTKAIRAAIDQIKVHEPDLAALLARGVSTGAFCSYTPLKQANIDWDVVL